jgi:hypothetical protein
VDEVNIDAVNRRLELGPAIQPGFKTTPVVLFVPVTRQFLRVCQWNTLVPIFTGFGLGPAGGCQPLVQIVEFVLRDGNAERGDVFTHAWMFLGLGWAIR